ncbi:MAG: hypothetical protein IJV86_01495 [Clostridia bacterium]|nr:hypothetical protein [Clostridia bacterium]
MSSKTHISPAAKKTLTGVGIAFGTVMIFLISFILTFSLIVNPINFMSVSDSDTIKENKELKEKVQTLTDEVEILNTTVEKYKASASAPQIPATVVTPQPEQNTSSGSASQQPSNETSSGDVASTPNEDESSSEESPFAPDTVTSTTEETPEDKEDPITIIDISE